MAEHTTEIRFATADGAESSTVWRDAIPPRYGDGVVLDWPQPLTSSSWAVGLTPADVAERWLCRVGTAAITWRGDVQIFTVCVERKELAPASGGAE
jgi:hypothetical protein